MTFFKLPVVSALLALSTALLVKADFPGSTFAITFNSTATDIPPAGYLALTLSQDGSFYYTTLSDVPVSDFSGFLTPDGTYATLQMACPTPNLIALLEPPAEPLGGLAYALTWRSSAAGAPAGSVVQGFELAAPDYDTLTNILAGPGAWRATPTGSPTQYIIGWTQEDTDKNDVSVMLLSSSAAGITY